MARMARVVAPGLPQHITQRGNRRQETFFCEDDYAAYIELMAEWCGTCGVEIWAYCLMIAVPEERGRLAPGHRRGAPALHPADQLPRRLAGLPVAGAVRIICHGRAIHPRGGTLHRAQPLARALDWRIRPCTRGRAQRRTSRAWTTDWHGCNRCSTWSTKGGAFLAGELDDDEWERLRAHERTGRPLGNAPFLQRLEGELGRRLRPRKGGRHKKKEN